MVGLGAGAAADVVEREGGFIVLLRQVRSSALWASLSAAQKGVTVTLLLLANWKPARARWGSAWYEVQRGELSHSLERIAEEAGCTVKVVRSTLAALMADDTDLGGNGAFIVERYPISGTGPGTGPRVLRVVKYDEYQRIDEAPGTGSGIAGAQQGHGVGTAGAEREPVKPEIPAAVARARARSEPAPAPVPAPVPAAAPLAATPATAGVLEALDRAGWALTAPGPDRRARFEAATAEAGVEAVVRIIRQDLEARTRRRQEVPGSAGFYLGDVVALAKRRDEPPPRALTVVDEGWFRLVAPAERRAEAEAAWAAKRAELEGTWTGNPEKVPGLLAQWSEKLRAEYLGVPPARAAGGA